VNTITDSIDTPNISSLDLCIPNPTLLQLLFIYRLKIKTMFTIGSVIYSLSSSFSICGFYISHPSLSFSMLEFASLIPFAFYSQYTGICSFFLNFKFHVFIRFELIHIDQHKVSFKLLNGHQEHNVI
jgi:hypothetical protein